jgi:hypothetical protein
MRKPTRCWYNCAIWVIVRPLSLRERLRYNIKVVKEVKEVREE